MAASPRRKPVRRWLLRNVIPPIATAIYRSLGNSWRYITENESALKALLAGDRPLVGAFLHARTFQLLHYFSHPDRGRWILMCSQSRDGEAMARLEEALGFRVARGSSGKGGARALVEMIKAQRDDRHLNSCLAIDGSRGPRGIAQLGILTLAQKGGGLLLPVAASSGNARIWRKSWDRTVFPRRGATVHVRIGEPIDVPAKLDALATEDIRLLLEQRMLALHAELDARTGFIDPQPLQARPVPVPTLLPTAIPAPAP
ncbi:MAG TPA: DUF374 domain-containing protein [Steroidobacteraceae bacterium]|nr:DUF374 domain-containing protein [Steroidobacteraceae bacterium]